MKNKICNCAKAKDLPLSEYSKVGDKYHQGQCKECRNKDAREKTGRGKGRFNAMGAARIDDELYSDVMRLM